MCKSAPVICLRPRPFTVEPLSPPQWHRPACKTQRVARSRHPRFLHQCAIMSYLRSTPYWCSAPPEAACFCIRDALCPLSEDRTSIVPWWLTRQSRAPSPTGRASLHPRGCTGASRRPRNRIRARNPPRGFALRWVSIRQLVNLAQILLSSVFLKFR